MGKTAKAVDDKTFGLKNKKGAKQQKFIEQVNKQAQHKHQGNNKQKEATLSKKAQKQAYLDQLDAILKPVDSERKVMLSKKQKEADKKKKGEQKAQEEKEAKQKTKYAKEGKIVSSTGKELFAYYKDQINVNDDEEVDYIDYN